MASHSSAVPVRSHPIHGILSAYPLAFFTGAFATDLIYLQSANMMWANFSAWLIAAGILMGVLAGLVGIVDAIAARSRRRQARRWPHSLLTSAMMIVALVNAFIHSRDAWTSVVPTGIILSAVATVLAIVSSWMGYSLQSRQETL
jgi:uncharacterized membrane protein